VAMGRACDAPCWWLMEAAAGRLQAVVAWSKGEGEWVQPRKDNAIFLFIRKFSKYLN
jgi:hypothetical protein